MIFIRALWIDWYLSIIHCSNYLPTLSLPSSVLRRPYLILSYLILTYLPYWPSVISKYCWVKNNFALTIFRMAVKGRMCNCCFYWFLCPSLGHTLKISLQLKNYETIFPYLLCSALLCSFLFSLSFPTPFRAVPDRRSLNILKEFSPLVEVAAGNG